MRNDDKGRTRIGNTPSCEDCGEQHNPEIECDPERLLDIAKEAQTSYWDALRKFEEATGLEIDSTSDLEGHTLASLRKGADGDEDEEEDEQEIPTCEACGCTDGSCQHAC